MLSPEEDGHKEEKQASKKVPFLKASDINPMAPKRENDLVADITVLRDIFVPGARVRI
jgi:hypothetical protein